jgi:hypothetical protein
MPMPDFCRWMSTQVAFSLPERRVRDYEQKLLGVQGGISKSR